MSSADDPLSSDDAPAEDHHDEDRHRRHRHGHRTWPERLAIIGTFGSAFLCFAIAAALIGGYTIARQRNIADFENPALAAENSIVQQSPPTLDLDTTEPPSPTEASETDAGAGSDTTSADSPGDTDPAAEPAATADSATTTEPAAPAVTFPDADPEAQNFLITGADNGACVDPDSPYAGTFGDREGMGERSDTIMVLRVDPVAKRVAILSFPRDLYVEIADGGGMSRINSAYERDEPQRLADTIYDNFDIPIDHYIQVDFCAFKTLVDAVGGVAVPFEYPARDDNTGLNVPEAGCFTFNGEHALAYVRSRHYEYEDPAGSGNWQTDPTSDLGRISRQQDFLRRTLSSLLDTGPLNPRVARGLIRATTTYITTDRDLTPAKMLEFAGVMNDVDPGSILTYQVEATGRTIGGAAVLIPNVDSENMQAVLRIFRGQTSLADAVAQVFEPTTAAVSRDSTTTIAAESTTPEETSQGDPTDDEDETDGTTEAPDSTATESTVPGGAPVQNEFGIVPPRDQTC